MSNRKPGTNNRVGLIAGWGNFPVSVAEALASSGRDVYCCAITGHADPRLQDICRDVYWVSLLQMGRHLRYFHRHGVRELALAGKIFKTLLFDRRFWFRNVPDLATLRLYSSVLFSTRGNSKDDTLLTIATNFFDHNGIRVRPATDYAPGLLVDEGLLTDRAPTATENADIYFGWHLAREMGRLDVGQSVTVKSRAVLAVEAIEGTDECIRRTRQICPAGGFVLVKVAKPSQDMRFDVPTIGVGTVETLHAAGGRAIAIEADRTIVLDRPTVVATANRLGIAIVALQGEQIPAFSDQSQSSAA